MYKIADLYVEMRCSGERLQKQALPYRVKADVQPDIVIDISDERLRQTKEAYPHLSFDNCEYIKKGFAFAYSLLDFSGFCLHASALEMDKTAVLFSAASGTGKSTHVGLWRKYFGPRATIINDDRPALRLNENEFLVYGTPWSGKTSLNTNMKAPLQAVVFLEQAEQNRIEKLSGREAVYHLYRHSIRPSHDSGKMNNLLTLLDALIKKTPLFKMGCNISLDAVRLAYETIYKRKF